MKSTEQIARSTYGRLSTRDRWVVMAWRDRGADWCTAMVNSGCISPTAPRVWPDQAARAEYSDRVDELILARYQRAQPTDDALRRRESSEHESAHLVVAQALNVKVSVATIAHDGNGGACLHARTTPLNDAIIALAAEKWIEIFRSLEFPGGPVGCADDRRKAVEALGGDSVGLRKAHKRCFELLRENSATILALADRIDQDGYAFPEGAPPVNVPRERRVGGRIVRGGNGDDSE